MIDANTYLIAMFGLAILANQEAQDDNHGWALGHRIFACLMAVYFFVEIV